MRFPWSPVCADFLHQEPSFCNGKTDINALSCVTFGHCAFVLTCVKHFHARPQNSCHNEFCIKMAQIYLGGWGHALWASWSHFCFLAPLPLWPLSRDVRVHHREQWGDREIGPRRGRRVFCAHFKAWMSTNSRVRPREL